MSQIRVFIEQTDPPRPAKETLPTMYDLPDEDREEPGLPDKFHCGRWALIPMKYSHRMTVD